MEIGSTNPTSTTSEEPTNVLEQSGLGQEAFLKLFLAQLEHQDPLSPQDPSELSAQLAQFSQFEQTLRMVEELRAINSRLDELLEATAAQEAQSVDPLTLLGREIEFKGDHVSVPLAGAASPLRFDVPETSQAVGFVVSDQGGTPIGQALIPPAGADRSVPISAGAYTIGLGEDGARLTGPTGLAESIEFARIRIAENGSLEPELDAEGNPILLSFDPGRTYGFAVGATTLTGQPLELSTTTTGTVEAVRNRDGDPTVVVNGQELQITQVIRIR
jgi:flagellar basal-body rod modification protein FlgD